MTNLWTHLQRATTPEQKAQTIEAAVTALKDLPPALLRDTEQLTSRARAALTEAGQRWGVGLAEQPDLLPHVIARVSGLGFLHALLPPLRTDLSEIALNPDGRVWVLPKGQRHFVALDVTPSPDDAWRVVEALLAQLGRAVSEAAPSVDAKLPRAANFGGARVKVLHPVIAPGRRYPALNVRLFEDAPVRPEQLIEWGVAPPAVVQGLLNLVQAEARVLVIGGTATGKTTWLAALANSIPPAARIVKIEDPEEIYLRNPNVVTLEARPAPPGSSVPPYTIRHGVDDAMRMAPQWLIVGEVRTGDAALALFRAQMSDHPGLSTFHAESPEQAVTRMALIMFADAGVEPRAAREIFTEAVDVVIQVGWQDGQRALLGVWEVGPTLAHGQVQFKPLYQPGMAQLQPFAGQKGLFYPDNADGAAVQGFYPHYPRNSRTH